MKWVADVLPLRPFHQWCYCITYFFYYHLSYKTSKGTHTLYLPLCMCSTYLLTPSPRFTHPTFTTKVSKNVSEIGWKTFFSFFIFMTFLHLFFLPCPLSSFDENASKYDDMYGMAYKILFLLWFLLFFYSIRWNIVMKTCRVTCKSKTFHKK